jgi:hypothetical protein
LGVAHAYALEVKDGEREGGDEAVEGQDLAHLKGEEAMSENQTGASKKTRGRRWGIPIWLWDGEGGDEAVEGQDLAHLKRRAGAEPELGEQLGQDLAHSKEVTRASTMKGTG